MAFEPRIPLSKDLFDDLCFRAFDKRQSASACLIMQLFVLDSKQMQNRRQPVKMLNDIFDRVV